jgi:hypothetical protein
VELKEKKEYKGEENDSEINFAIFLNANANYAMLQIFTNMQLRLYLFMTLIKTKICMNVQLQVFVYYFHFIKSISDYKQRILLSFLYAFVY